MYGSENRMRDQEGAMSDSSILDAQIEYSCDDAKDFACVSNHGKVEEEHCDKLESVLSTDSRLEMEATEVIDCDAANSDTENVSNFVISVPNDNQGYEEKRDGSPEDRRVSSYEDISPSGSDRVDILLTTLLPVAAFLPVMKGDFRVVLQGNARDKFEICFESCDTSMQIFAGMHLVYVAAMTQVSIGAAFITSDVVELFNSGGEVKQLGYESKEVGYVELRLRGCGTLGAYSSLRPQGITGG